MDSREVSITTVRGRVVENTIRDESDPERLFNLGLLCLKQYLLPEAKLAIGRAYKLNPAEPRYCSYYGLLLALVDNELQCAMQLCESAVLRDFLHADLFCNLGRVYLLAGLKEKAYRTFNNGLKVDMGDKDLRRELKKMGARKMPLFSFLKRDHPLNYMAGKIGHLLIGAKTSAAPDSYQILSMQKVGSPAARYDFAGHPQLKLKRG
ncbi:MAG: hypothetical protein WCQ99_07740 [Pseudomonadota bacterium]